MPPRLGLLVDSTCGPFGAEIAGVPVRSVTVSVRTAGGDLVDDDAVTVAALQRSGLSPTTSRPSPDEAGAALDALRAGGVERVVAVVLSSQLSGTYDAIVLAARARPWARVVDSRTVGLAQRFLVEHIARFGDGGQHPASRTEFSLDSLDQLRRSGRLGAAAAAVGTVLAIRPVLGVEEGRIGLVARVRTSGRARARLRAEAAALIERGWRVGLQHAGRAEEAAELAAELGLGPPHELSGALVAHTGSGLLGFAAQEPPAGG